MKARAVLVVSCRDRGTQEGLASVLTPDNEGGPRGLGVSMRGRGSKLEILVEADSAATTLSTCLAFLRDVALFQEVWLLSHRKAARVQRT
ncbi:MAG: hypothetical protein KGI26_01110 [Thaumarchaeota archaeon]|nr:hypothetical protein [Nitrososphaerota archaeon]